MSNAREGDRSAVLMIDDELDPAPRPKPPETPAEWCEWAGWEGLL